jgi:hypothetical protein
MHSCYYCISLINWLAIFSVEGGNDFHRKNFAVSSIRHNNNAVPGFRVAQQLAIHAWEAAARTGENEIFAQRHTRHLRLEVQLLVEHLAHHFFRQYAVGRAVIGFHRFRYFLGFQIIVYIFIQIENSFLDIMQYDCSSS